MDYSEQQDVCAQQTSSSWTEEEKFVMHCQETQDDIESSYYHPCTTNVSQYDFN